MVEALLSEGALLRYNAPAPCDLAANLIALTAAMSFSQLDKTLNVRTKVQPLVLAGLIALIASLEVSSLPGADESLRQANAGRIQTSSPGVIGAPMEHDAIIYSARFSPDGKRIVTASKDGTARVWDAAMTTKLFRRDSALTAEGWSLHHG